MDITTHCKRCSSPQRLQLAWPLTQQLCSDCQGELFLFSTDAFLKHKQLDQCPFCGASHLYQRKDFNQKLGIFLIVVGVALAYFTYGISLLVVTAVDWILSKRVRLVGVCYQCLTEFRNSSIVSELPPFNLQLFDYYKNLKQTTD